MVQQSVFSLFIKCIYHPIPRTTDDQPGVAANAELCLTGVAILIISTICNMQMRSRPAYSYLLHHTGRQTERQKPTDRRTNRS